MSDINNVTNYNDGLVDLSEIKTFNEEVERLKNKCKEANINVEINTEYLHEPDSINLILKNKHNEILNQNDNSLKIDIVYYDYGEYPAKILHANMLIRYNGKMFFFDTTPDFHVKHKVEIDQINKITTFQRNVSSCYIKSLKNAELFIDLIKNNPSILENNEVTTNLLRLDYSKLENIELNEYGHKHDNFFVNAPLFAIINSDMVALKHQYFDYLIKENRILNSEDRLNALQNLKEQLGNTELNNDQRKEINIKLEYANNILISENVEQSKSINNFMLKQMICQQIHQTNFSDYGLIPNCLVAINAVSYILMDNFATSADRTEQLLDFAQYCQDLPKLQEKFVNETMKKLYPDNPEVYELIKNAAKDITIDDLINNLPANYEFQNILMTFNKFCKDNNLDNSYQNLLEFNKQHYKDHLKFMEDGKFGNEIDLEILETLKLKTKTMDLNVNFKTKKVIQQEKPIVKITSKTTQITNEQLKRLEESTKEIGSLTDKLITKSGK